MKFIMTKSVNTFQDEWALGTDYIFNKTRNFDLINYTFDNAITQDAEGKYVCWEENQVEDCEGITFIKTVEDNKLASGFDIYVEQVNRLKTLVMQVYILQKMNMEHPFIIVDQKII